MSAAEPLPWVVDDSDAPTAAEDVRLELGVRIVDGRPMYSSAWIDFEAATPR
jgi:hypothetical protein